MASDKGSGGTSRMFQVGCIIYFLLLSDEWAFLSSWAIYHLRRRLVFMSNARNRVIRSSNCRQGTGHPSRLRDRYVRVALRGGRGCARNCMMTCRRGTTRGHRTCLRRAIARGRCHARNGGYARRRCPRRTPDELGSSINRDRSREFRGVHYRSIHSSRLSCERTGYRGRRSDCRRRVGELGALCRCYGFSFSLTKLQ